MAGRCGFPVYSGPSFLEQDSSNISDKSQAPQVSLVEALQESWLVRSRHFSPEIIFVYPRRTLAVRSTGLSCPLNCAHCAAHYLKGMVSLDQALRQKGRRYTSFLLSGDSNRQGRVPHQEKWLMIGELALKGKLNIHSGLVGEEEARQIGCLAETVSFDFVADAETIGQVYGLPVGPEKFLETYRSLRRYCRVVPHICIGLSGGRIRGEYRVLQMLREEGAEAISFIVFRPTIGTKLERCLPPPLEDVARILAFARISFPRTPLYLGCLRPGGSYREKLDCLALQAGVNKIVQPAVTARHLAQMLGLAAESAEECCVL